MINKKRRGVLKFRFLTLRLFVLSLQIRIPTGKPSYYNNCKVVSELLSATLCYPLSYPLCYVVRSFVLLCG
jgi:hypothetical protein